MLYPGERVFLVASIAALTGTTVALFRAMEQDLRGWINTSACAYGGIGRRVGFRFQWETVWVQVPLSAFKTL